MDEEYEDEDFAENAEYIGPNIIDEDLEEEERDTRYDIMDLTDEVVELEYSDEMMQKVECLLSSLKDSLKSILNNRDHTRREERTFRELIRQVEIMKKDLETKRDRV